MDELGVSVFKFAIGYAVGTFIGILLIKLLRRLL